MVLENNTVVVPNFYRDYDQEFGKKGGKIGDTLFVRKPPRFLGTDGQAYSPEGLTDTQVPVVVNQQSGVHFEFSSAEKYLSLDDFKSRYLDKAAVALANKLDQRAALMAMQNTANLVGTPGTTPGLNSSDALLIYAQAGQKLDEMGFPLKDGRCMIITPAARVGWIDFFKTTFNPQPSIAAQYKTGQVSDAIGYKWYVDQNIPTQTLGAPGSGQSQVTGANQTGTSINTKSWQTSQTGVLLVGDVISFAGVYAVNPQSRQSTGSLQQFVVQANANSDGGGLSTLTLFPAIVPSGQFQNVSASPADSANIYFYGALQAGWSALSGLASPQQLLFHKEAFTFVSFPGDVPDGVDMGFEDRSSEIGVSLRFVRIFDGFRDTWINRFDVYYGIAPLYSEGACRVAS